MFKTKSNTKVMMGLRWMGVGQDNQVMHQNLITLYMEAKDNIGQNN